MFHCLQKVTSGEETRFGTWKFDARHTGFSNTNRFLHSRCTDWTSLILPRTGNASDRSTHELPQSQQGKQREHARVERKRVPSDKSFASNARYLLSGSTARASISFSPDILSNQLRAGISGPGLRWMFHGTWTVMHGRFRASPTQHHRS